MPFRKTTRSEKCEKPQPQGYSFFYLTPPTTNRCLELQQGIEKQQAYIAKLKNYNLYAKEPIEYDIKEHKIYKKKVKSALTKIEAKIVESETKISYKLYPMTVLPSETSKLKNTTIYIDSITGECKVVEPNQKNTASFYLSKNLDLSNLNVPGLKSEILSLMLQKSIINDSILQQQIEHIKKQYITYKAHQGRLQETEDRLIELNQSLNCICKQIDDYEKLLPQEKQLLKQLQVELAKTLIESVTQEIEPHFRPLPPGA